MGYNDILAAALELPRKDQKRLAYAITTNLTSDIADSELTPEVRKEFERRIAAYDADPSIGIPLDELEKEMEEYLQELGE